MLALIVERMTVVAIGLCAGSFATTAAIRYGRGEPFVGGRSHCDSCGRALTYFETVPVLSFLAQRGACARCGARISRLHLAGELLAATACVAAFEVAPPIRAVAISLLALLLIALSIIDLETMRLPLGVTLVVLAVSILLARDLRLGVIVAALTWATLWSLRKAYLVVRKKSGLGLGDVNLAAALAVWLGFATPWAIAVGAALGLIGSILKPAGQERIPFGPALAAGGLVVGLAEEVLRWPS